MRLLTRSLFLTCLIVLVTVSTATAVPFSINVQGRLSDAGGNPIGGQELPFDFKIFTAQTAGNELWPKVDETGERHLIVPDAQGLWTVNIGTEYPISPEIFSERGEIDDSTRWLQITVDGQTLPRVRLMSGPYAMKVGSLDGAFGGNIYGNINLHSQLKVGDEVGDGGVIKVTDGAVTTITAEGLTGDLTIAGKATLGDGHTNSGDYGFVAGSGCDVTANYATAGGGLGNHAGANSATVSGGSNNYAGGSAAVIGGGANNQATGDYSTVGGGTNNRARGYHSVIAGGGRGTTSVADTNSALGSYSVIAGGSANIAGGNHTVISGGKYNQGSGQYDVVSGGYDNETESNYASISGGFGNLVSIASDGGAIGGGIDNLVQEMYGALGGGYGNNVNGESAVIGGGDSNKVSVKWGTIAGGKDNLVSSSSTGGFVGGGRGNSASGPWTVVVGGTDNSTSLTHGTVGGGSSNRAWGTYSTVPGGRDNEASASYTFAAGRRAKALHAGSFVWADDTDADFASTGADQFLIRVADGVGINTNNPVAKLTIAASSTSDPGIYISGSARDLTWPSGQSFQFGTLSGATFDELVRIESGGDVGIGTVSPNYKLDVRGTIGNNATLYHSDKRWKTQVRPLTSSLENILKLKGVSYEWKREEFADMHFPEGRHIGVIAQDVEKVIPEVVRTADDGYKSVEYAKLVAVLIEAVKAQQEQLEEQGALIGDLQDRIQDLERKGDDPAS